jgi:hypothetical protein
MRWYGVRFNLSLEKSRNDLARRAAESWAGWIGGAAAHPPSFNIPLTETTANADSQKKGTPDLVLDNSSITRGSSEVLFFFQISTPPRAHLCAPFRTTSTNVNPSSQSRIRRTRSDKVRPDGGAEVHLIFRVLASRVHLFFEGFQKQQG